MFDLIEGTAKLALIVACLYFVGAAYVSRNRPAWIGPLGRRRFAILATLILAVFALAVGEDVVGRETAPIDTAILLFVHDRVPHALDGFFSALTLTGSAMVLVPLTTATTAWLLYARHRAEAALMAASVVIGSLVVYAVKAAVDRDRPSLWNTQWYWGSSFPSGHTLVVAAFATAAALCLIRIKPRLGSWPLVAAFVWTALVGLSRLVLGVHWPTDVLVAACTGAFLPLAIGLALDRPHD
jgi:undecaprenyl-diphosphatase